MAPRDRGYRLQNRYLRPCPGSYSHWRATAALGYCGRSDRVGLDLRRCAFPIAPTRTSWRTARTIISAVLSISLLRLPARHDYFSGGPGTARYCGTRASQPRLLFLSGQDEILSVRPGARTFL